MRLIDRIRLAHGLRWSRSRPTIAELRPVIDAVLFAVALFAILGVADAMEQATERAIHAEKAAEIFEASAKVLRDCERGAIGYHYPDGRAFECSKPL